MGIFTAKLRVWNPVNSSSSQETEAMMDDDSGASLAGFCERGSNLWVFVPCGECRSGRLKARPSSAI
jgi:hypothetical protein